MHPHRSVARNGFRVIINLDAFTSASMADRTPSHRPSPPQRQRPVSSPTYKKRRPRTFEEPLLIHDPYQNSARSDSGVTQFPTHYLNHKMNVHYNMTPTPGRRSPPRGSNHLTSANERADHTIIAKMVDLQTRQSNIGAAIQTMENIIYKQRAQIEELERALLLKGNKATFENHLKLKADNAMVEQLFERNMKYSLQLSKKYNVTHDDIAKAVSNKVGTEAVETLAKEVDDIRSSIRSTVQEHLVQLTLGVRDRLRNVCTKNELKLGLKSKVDNKELQHLQAKMERIHKYIYNDLDDEDNWKIAGVNGRIESSPNNDVAMETFETNIATSLPLQTRIGHAETALDTRTLPCQPNSPYILMTNRIISMQSEINWIILGICLHKARNHWTMPSSSYEKRGMTMPKYLSSTSS